MIRIVYDVSAANYPRRTGIGRLQETILEGAAEVMEAGEWTAGRLECVSALPFRLPPVLVSRLERAGAEFKRLRCPSVYLFRCFLLPWWARARGAALTVLPEPVFTPLAFPPPYTVIVNDLLYADDPATMTPWILRMYRNLAPRGMREARSIGAISRFTAERARAVHPELAGRDIAVLPMAAPPPAVPKPPRPAWAPEAYAFMAGRLLPRKNIRGLVAAFERWREVSPGNFIPLVLAGVGDARVDDIEPWLKERAERGILIRPGYVSGEDLEALTANARFLAFPSLYEGYGLPIIEAMARGVPVLTSRGGAMEEAAGGAALLVDPRDREDIVRGLDTLTANEDLRRDLTARGLARAAELTPRKLGNAFHELILAGLAAKR